MSLHSFSSLGIGVSVWPDREVPLERRTGTFIKAGLVTIREDHSQRQRSQVYITLYFDNFFYPLSIHIVIYPSTIPTMSVFTIVHRALPPLSLPWKRRTILKAKSPELQILSEKDTILPNSPGISITPHAQDNAPLFMHRDAHGPVQVAVKAHADHEIPTPQSTSSAPENIPDPASDSTSENRVHYSSQTRSIQTQLARAVSWASIIRSRDRWTVEQERELVHAQRQLGRCQKAWSSEQEVWLSYVCGNYLFLFLFLGGVLFALTIVLFHAVEIVITFPNLISSRKRITP